MPIEIRKLTSRELEALPRENTVFFFPVGPLEDHGPHLPMGLDLEEASRLCYLAAQHLEAEIPGWVGVIMPPAPLGIDSNTTQIAITVRPHVLRDWLVDSSRSLIRNGFYHFVCFSGHLGPKQLTAIEEAGSIIRKTGRWTRLGGALAGRGKLRPSLVSASSSFVSFKDVLKSPFWPDPEEHGGERDTSMALALMRDWVDPAYQSLPPVEKASSRWSRNFKRRLRQLGSYWGKPESAQAQVGEKEVFAKLEKVFPKLRAVWEGANPNFLFRSWYSIFPPNKSFFKAWLLALWIVVVLVLWSLTQTFDV
jgi:creatinine amidohydrolase